MNCNIIGGTHLNITLAPKGGQQITKTVDLQLYKREDIPQLDGYEFCYLMGFDISSYDTDSAEYKSLRQFLLRLEDRSEEDIEGMQDSYLRNHWSVKLGPPPQFSMNEYGEVTIDDIINGRRRTGGAIEAKGNIIPIAVYKPIKFKSTDLSDKSWVMPDLNEEQIEYKHKYENAQKLNDEVGSEVFNKMVDYVQLGVDFVKNGIIGDTIEDIGNWLERDMDYKDRFPNPSNQSEIVNKIDELAHADYDLSDQWTAPDADQWIKDNGYLTKDQKGHWNKDVYLACVDDPRWVHRVMAEITASVLNGNNPPEQYKIIFYSKRRKPEDIKKNMLRYGDGLEMAFVNFFKVVEVLLGNTQTFNVPKYRPYVVGCIPQIKGEEGYGGNKTVSYEQMTKGVTYRGRAEVLKNHPDYIKMNRLSLPSIDVPDLEDLLSNKQKRIIDLSLGIAA